MENFKLPVGVAIRVDDVGWFEGADDRHIGRPSRSGLPRRHHPNDILVLNEIGKGLGTKVLCNLILGEWDFYGLTFKVALQVILNLAVVTNSMPNTGISLPFFSYGGTSLMLQIFEVGIILSISRYASHKKI